MTMMVDEEQRKLRIQEVRFDDTDEILKIVKTGIF